MDHVEVRIPEPLRGFAGGERLLHAAPGTVAEVLDELGGRHPQLLQRIVAPEGGLRPYVNLFVGRANVRGLQGLDTPVPSGAVLSILPAVAGG
jgi:molybdopterin converting factor small subunit